MRAFVADLDAWSSAAKAEDARADSEPAAFAPRDKKAGAPVRGATRATVTATGDVAGNPKPSSSSSALRDGMPTLADLNAAEQKMDGHGVGGVFAEAAKREAESKAEDLSVSGATRADREKLLAGLRDAPARERRWAAAREKEKGNELFKAREYRSAIEAYDVSIALDAANPAPFANRAAAYMKLRRWSDAARDCDAALALDPEHFKALLRRGACALEANEQDAASVALRDFELCAVIEARRRTKEGEPSDAELVRLTALAKKTLNETREKTARAAMRRVAIEEDDGGSSSSSSSSSSEPSKKAPPVVAPARRGPMVIEEIVEDPEPKSSKIKIKIEEASDSDDDDDDASIPIDHEGSSIDIAARVAALKEKGNERFARGAYEDAIVSYDEAIRAFERSASNDGAREPPVDARARAVLYANRAASLLKRSDFARAERDANDAIACDPTYVKGFHRRAAARAGLNAFEGALEDYEKVVRAAPESEALRREVNACMEKAAEAMLGGLNGGARGDIAAALSSGAKAVTIEPDSDDDSDDDDDDDDDAPETKAAPAIETNAPERTPPRSSRAPASSGTKARAVVIVEEDSSDDENEPRDGITTANEHENHESRETSETFEQHAFGTSQTSPETKKSPETPRAASASASAHKDRGNALFRAGDYAGAESAYSAAIAADPTNAAAFYANRAAAHLKLGAHDAALRDAEDALALDPEHARARHRRAAALAALGPPRAAEAAAEYARVAAAHPGHAGVAAESAAAADAARRAAEDHAAKEDRKEDFSAAPKPKLNEGETAKPTRSIVAESPSRRQPRAPRTATEFERGCASLRGDPDALLAFLGSVDDAELPRVLKHSVSAKILGAYCVAFASALDERGPGSPFANEAAKARTAATLAALAATPRFALAAAALGAADKRAIARVFEALGEACASETRDAWR